MESQQVPHTVVIDVNEVSSTQEEEQGQKRQQQQEQEHDGDGEKEEEEEIEKEKRRSSAALVEEEEDVVVVDLESGNEEVKVVHLSKSERDCRICHMSLDAANQESGVAMELGCSCKDDLAAAHKQCAETWFKIKGNKICEVCGSIAYNVAGANEAESAEHWNEANDGAPQSSVAAVATSHVPEARNFWQGHRFLNFLLALMVFAFVISWLFHFNVPS